MKLSQHKEYSVTQLKMLSDKFAKIEELKNNFLCIYVTGSYGRLEASKNSDIDLFFIDAASSIHDHTSGIDKTLIHADLIKICRSMNLPEFSKDGLYLKIHRLNDIKENLGSPYDDYQNFFTSRMLLLLESKVLYDEDLYNQILESIIDSYYRDFHRHSEDFKPIFLANDIMRFWKTLLLNYEHSRNRSSKVHIKNGKGLEKHKAIVHSKNLKLKFSRKLICFSFLIQLLANDGTITQEDVVKISKLTPVERISSLKEISCGLSGDVDDLLSSYQWFIDHTQVPSEQMLKWISNKSNRDDAFDRSRKFGEKIFEIMMSVDNQNLIQKLLI